MAKTKNTGVSRLGRDSQPKYLGIKISEGGKVRPGMVIIKQRGTKLIAGKNVKRGSDDTLYALKEGVVKFTDKRKKCFNGSVRAVKVVNVEPR